MNENDLLEKFSTEFKRGNLTLVVLSQLNEPEYGYSLLEKLKAKGLEIEANTLYPLLRRLESNKLLDCMWDTNEARPRKYYSLSEFGHTTYELLKEEWLKQTKSINEILGGNENEK